LKNSSNVDSVADITEDKNESNYAKFLHIFTQLLLLFETGTDIGNVEF